jgi:Tfp pilus assembly protein PilX
VEKLRHGSRPQAGQALVEYTFLLIVLATIGIAVIVLAGNQLQRTYVSVRDHIVHLTEQDWQNQHTE